VQPNNLYRCLDKLTAHKQAMLTFLGERWKELFAADFEVLLYDPKSGCSSLSPRSYEVVFQSLGASIRVHAAAIRRGGARS
jgi:hypothetical protein